MYRSVTSDVTNARKQSSAINRFRSRLSSVSGFVTTEERLTYDHRVRRASKMRQHMHNVQLVVTSTNSPSEFYSRKCRSCNASPTTSFRSPSLLGERLLVVHDCSFSMLSTHAQRTTSQASASQTMI